jgi:hypothetical protein
MPLSWRHQNIQPLFRNFGPDYSCDLCFIVQGKGLFFPILIQPGNFPTHGWKSGAHLRIHIEVRADELCLNQQYDIVWDGKWEDADSDMEKHVRIEPIRHNRKDEASG